MDSHPPGPLADDKREPGARRPQPEAAETESARLLVNDARRALPAIPEPELVKLADRFIAEDRGEGTDEFVDWVRAQAS